MAGDDVQRIGKEVYIGLLDALASVGGMFQRNTLSIFQDGQPRGNLTPERVGLLARNVCSHAGNIEIGNGYGIGKCIVVDIGSIFIGTHHIIDVIAMARGISLGARHPKVGCGLDEWPGLGCEPSCVACHAVVLPCCMCHAAGDVVLKGACECPCGCFFHASVAAFPWEHGTVVAMLPGVGHGCLKAIDAIVDHGASHVGVQQYQGGEYPYIGVPKHVSVVSQSREPHG